MNLVTLLAFVAVVAIIAAAYVYKSFGSFQAAYYYFRYNDIGRQAWKGILMFIGGALVLAGLAFVLNALLASKAAAAENWFTYGQVYLGAEKTSDLNTICDPGGVDDRTTSHGGIRVNLFRSTDRKFETNVKYTHHSCAFGGDRHVYDAFGMEASLKLWGD